MDILDSYQVNNLTTESADFLIEKLILLFIL